MFLLVRVQVRQPLAAGLTVRVEKLVKVVCDPAFDQVDEKFEVGLVLGEADALNAGGLCDAEADRNTAIGQSGWKRSASGKGPGRKGVISIHSTAKEIRVIGLII